MKKKRLKLKELKVKSFITLTNLDSGETIKGGLRAPGDDLVPHKKTPGDTALCQPTPATFCYHCPPEY